MRASASITRPSSSTPNPRCYESKHPAGYDGRVLSEEAVMPTYALIEKAIVLKPEDDVAVAKAALGAGTLLEDGTTRIEVRQDIGPGHKVARRARRAGEPVRRYGQVIGFATRDIAVGDHVHSHNLDIGELSADRYEVGVDVTPVEYYPPTAMRTFDGYGR